MSKSTMLKIGVVTALNTHIKIMVWSGELNFQRRNTEQAERI